MAVYATNSDRKKYSLKVTQVSQIVVTHFPLISSESTYGMSSHLFHRLLDFFCLGSILFVLLLLTKGFGSGRLFDDAISGRRGCYFDGLVFFPLCSRARHSLSQ